MGRRQTSLTSLQQISDINLTPLMDLTFILLITFIITFPLIEQGVPINLPQGKSEEIEPKEARTISLDIEGQIYLDDIAINAEQLTAEMNELGTTSPKTIVFVRADSDIAYGKVIDVVKILHAAKLGRLALVTQPEGGK